MARQRSLEILELFPCATRTASANGAGVDLQGYVNPGGREMKAYINCGEASGTTPTLDVKLQESDDNATFSDIDGAAFSQLTGPGSEEIHFRTNKRYVRAVATIGGGTPSFTFGAFLVAEKRMA